MSRLQLRVYAVLSVLALFALAVDDSWHARFFAGCMIFALFCEVANLADRATTTDLGDHS